MRSSIRRCDWRPHHNIHHSYTPLCFGDTQVWLSDFFFSVLAMIDQKFRFFEGSGK